MAHDAPDELTAVPLTDEQLDRAFVLVSLCHDDVTPEGWRRHVEASWEAVSSAWMVVQDRRGYVRALYRRRVEDTLTCGRTLWLGDILVAGLGRRLALEAIDEDARLAAEMERCGAIHVNGDGIGDVTGSISVDNRRFFLEAGFREEGGHLCRRLGPKLAASRTATG